jgi:phage protein U
MSYRETINGIIQRAVGAFQGNDSGNAPVMMMLGGFKFSLNTAVFQEFERRTSYAWPAQERVGQYAALQYTGPGDDRVTLPGVIFPDWRGGAGQIDELRALASQGRPLQLITAAGDILGEWVIDAVDERASVFKTDGTPRKQEFVVSLKKYGDG